MKLQAVLGRLDGAARAAAVMGAFMFSAGWSSASCAEDSGDPVRGQRLFLQCQACHSLQPGSSGNVGPGLAGVVGRKAGSVPEYTYSAVLSSSGLVWDEATLDKWLEHPNGLVPGTKMIFAGVGNRADRLAIIGFLKTVKASGSK